MPRPRDEREASGPLMEGRGISWENVGVKGFPGQIPGFWQESSREAWPHTEACRAARRERVKTGSGERKCSVSVPRARAGGTAVDRKKSARRPVSRVLSAAPRLPEARRDGHSSAARLAARLTRPTRAAGREHPRRPRCRHRVAGRPYSVLLPVGFTLPPPLPGARCALAAPFHPCRSCAHKRRSVFCGTVPGVAPAGR